MSFKRGLLPPEAKSLCECVCTSEIFALLQQESLLAKQGKRSLVFAHALSLSLLPCLTRVWGFCTPLYNIISVKAFKINGDINIVLISLNITTCVVWFLYIKKSLIPPSMSKVYGIFRFHHMAGIKKQKTNSIHIINNLSFSTNNL